MANFPDTPTWVEVKELDNTDKILGITATGEYGASNVPHSQQTQRTAYLKSTLETNYYTKSEVNAIVQSLIPTGAIMYTGQNTPPPYWAYMEGYWFLKSAYPELWASVQDSPSTFNLSSSSGLSFQIYDTSEAFLRPVSAGNNGRVQRDAMRNILGGMNNSLGANSTFTGSMSGSGQAYWRVFGSKDFNVALYLVTAQHNSANSNIIDKDLNVIESGTLGSAGLIDNENRPKNVGVRAIICLGRQIDLSNPPSSTPL